MNTRKYILFYFCLITVLISAGLSCQLPSDSPDSSPNSAVEGGSLAITGVHLSNAAPAVKEWVTVEVTVENQGDTVVSGYELVLIAHYGDGPPNPSGVEPLPDMAPGATYVVMFDPGLLYMIAGTATVRVLATDTWYELGDAESTGDLGDYWDEPIMVSAAAASEAAKLVITEVQLSTTAPAVKEWVTVEVTVENQGDTVVSGYELVLIAHYGDGPPNPSGVEPLPDIAPGATYVVMFDPGLLYMIAGTATVRVLATDTWYELGDANSIGDLGDFWDEPIVIKNEK